MITEQLYLKFIKTLCLMDDVFFSAVFMNQQKALSLVLNTILDNSEIDLISAETQFAIISLAGRSSFLDSFATDSHGNHYNLEVQKKTSKQLPKRVRYYGVAIDSISLQKGQSTDELKETHVIFITRKDYYGQNCPVYHVDDIVRELGIPFNAGIHYYIVNGEYEGDNDIGKLMHDFRCTDPDDMKIPLLANIVRSFKETKEGIEMMYECFEDYVNEERIAAEEKGRAEGMVEGEAKGRLECIISLTKSLLKSGMSPEEVAQKAEVPLEQVLKLFKEQ